jgi:REP element-mobilizing transposase RayT
VDRQFLFGPEEKEHFVSLLHKQARFCQLEVLTYCVMSNHFHLLILVPQKPEQLPSDEELFHHLESCGVSSIRLADLKQKLAHWTQLGATEEIKALQESYWNRCWDLSFFMKGLKQEFTQWFNRKHHRKGTLWEERFKSVLVEGEGEVLLTMAAYIDLNPIRAGLVEDPKEYRWCGYAEAVGGGEAAHAGIVKMAGGPEPLERYRELLYMGAMEQGVSQAGRPMRRGLTRERIEEVLGKKGKLSVSEMLTCRVRYFCDGAILGSQGFVEKVFAQNRDRYGSKRKTGARKMRYVDSPHLYTLRDLRVSVIKPSG